MPVFSVSRAGAAMVAGAAIFGALGARVGYLQTYGREMTVRQAERQQHREQVLPARRGCVFDRNGLLMAGTLESKVVFVDPKFLIAEFTRAAETELKARDDRAKQLARGKKPATLTPEQQAKSAERLAQAKAVFPGKYAPWDGIDLAIERAMADVAEQLRRDTAELFRTVLDRQQDRFLKLATRVDDVTAEEIAKLKIPGIGFQAMPVRAYPMDDMAAHILGGISGDGVGIDGLEARYEKDLRGRNGFLRELTDSTGKPIAVTAEDYVAPTHGRHLVLTIDSNIQLIAEQELRKSIAQFGAKAGEVVVMDPWTGEVLALANWPTFRPAEYLESPVKSRMNRALVAPYEPGSTIKPFIVAPALEWKLTRPDEMFNTRDGKYQTSYGRKVSDVHAYPSLALWDVLVKSSNVGMALLGERMGNAKLRQALAGFEFGKPTGIELPGEAGGIMRPLSKWTKYSTESVVQGYEIMVTPVQLARGMSAIANGGTLVRPTVVRGFVEGQGEVRPGARDAKPAASRTRRGTGNEAVLASTGAEIVAGAIGGVGMVGPAGVLGSPAGVLGSPAEAIPTGPVLSADTTAEMRRILADVLVRGTGTRARSDTYNIFGKTGTAHLTVPGKKGYSPDLYTSSFIGGAPYEQPKLVVAFVIHEAEKRGKQYYGGTTAAPGGARVLQRSLRYLDTAASAPLAAPEAGLAKRLYNYDEKKYTAWPENVRKERAAEAKSAPGAMLRPASRPAGTGDGSPGAEEETLPEDMMDPDATARPAADRQ